MVQVGALQEEAVAALGEKGFLAGGGRGSVLGTGRASAGGGGLGGAVGFEAGGPEPVLFVQDGVLRQYFDRLDPGLVQGFIFLGGERKDLRQSEGKGQGDISLFG